MNGMRSDEWFTYVLMHQHNNCALFPCLDGCIPNLLKTCDCESCKQASLEQGGEQQ